MRFFKLAVISAAISIAAVPVIASAKPIARSSGSTTTFYNKGKPVGKAVTHGNTTRYYSHGKPAGKSVRR